MTLPAEAKALIGWSSAMAGLWSAIVAGVGVFVSGLAGLLIASAFSATGLLVGTCAVICVKCDRANTARLNAPTE